MFSMSLYGLWLYYFILPSVFVVSGFNLSPKHAVVFKDPSGQEGSYFGYTVALQQDGWLLVGAPRGNSTHSNHLNITEPGMMYQCKIKEGANCDSQLLDSAGNDRNEKQNYLQHRHNAWAGGALDLTDVRNGHIVVCGPRWMYRVDETKKLEIISGICYLKNVSNPEKDGEKLLPLNNKNNFHYKKKPNDPDTLRNISYYYVYGQVGMSVHFTREGDEVIIGAPGVLDWTGTVVRYKTSDRRVPVIPNPLRTPELKNYTYLGYSVSSGNFISGRNKTYYVSGAPRGGKEFQGKVYVFDFHNATSTGEEYQMQVIHELQGEQAGEYFGAAICVLDMNNDGLDDILVGAPHYGDPKTWDQGRIRVYLTTSTTENITFFTDILGPRQSGAQFGAAVSSLGDINKDDYDDFVVGAPFEHSGTGVIYVYHGGKKGPNTEFSQRIVGSEIRADILGFGISFSRSLDVDGNKYNDIAVGAYKSGHAIVLKTRPIISYEANVTADVSSIGFNATSFKIEACLTYNGKNVPPKVDTKVILILDKTYQRVRPSNITYEVTLSESQSICSNYSVEIESLLQDFSKPIQLVMKYMPKNESNGDMLCKLCPVVDPNKPSSVKAALPYATGCHKDDSCTPSLNITAEFIDVASPLIIGSQATVSMNVSVQNSAEPAFLAYAVILLPAICPLVRLPQSCHLDDYHDETEPNKKLICLIGNPLSKGKKRTLQLEFMVENVASGTEEFLFSTSAESSGTERTPHDNRYNLTLSFVTQADIGLSGFTDKNEMVFSKRNETNEIKKEFTHFYEVTNFGPSPLKKVDLEFKIPVSYEEVKQFIRIDDIRVLNKGKQVSCKRSDTGLQRLSKTLHLVTISEQTNTTEQFDFSDMASPEFSDTTESGNTWKFEGTTESGNASEFEGATASGNASEFEGATASGNASESEDTKGEGRSVLIEPEVSRTEQTQSTERKVLIDCRNKKTTCITLSCSLYGPMESTFKAYVSFRMSATIEDLENVMGNMEAIIFSTRGKATITDPKNVQQTQENSPDEKDVVSVFHGRIQMAVINPAILGGAAAGALLLLIIIIIILWKYGFFKRKNTEEQYRALIKKQEDE